jgi:ferredoxin
VRQKIMKKVYIEPGCITCGACEFVAPEVFEVTDVSRVKTDADMVKNADQIEEAVRMCPVNVIKYQK